MAADPQALFSFEFDPSIGAVRIGIVEWASALDDWSAPFRDISRLFASHEKRHLESKGKSTGHPFPALSSGRGSYGDWKGTNYPGRRILQRDGVLYRALVKGGPGSIQGEIGKRRMRVGIDPSATTTSPPPFWFKRRTEKGKAQGDRPYALGKAALAHSTGITTKQRWVIPKRPPVRLSPSVTDRGAFGYAVQQLLQAHIVKARQKSPALQKALKDKFGGAPKDDSLPRKVESIINGQWK